MAGAKIISRSAMMAHQPPMPKRLRSRSITRIVVAAVTADGTDEYHINRFMPQVRARPIVRRVLLKFEPSFS